MGSRWWVGAFVLAGCRPEYSVARQERVDVFEQDRLAAIDLLLVVDNSRSMRGEQDRLAVAFDTLITALESGNTDWRVAVTTPETSFEPWVASLEGAMDEIVLEGADGTELDALAWDDRQWEVVRGGSFSRCGADTWTAEPPSRGAPNPCAPPAATGADDGPRPPGPGELLVNEVAPLASEPGCGWFELYNPTASTLDLAGVVARDDGRDAFALPEGQTLSPGETLVWTAFSGCGAADLVNEGMHLADGTRWVDAETEDAGRTFSELVTVGDGSFGLEMGFENAFQTLKAPAHPVDAGFLREDADLAVVFVSDEDDGSPDSVDDYINAFRGLKGTAGRREAERVRLAVVAGIQAPVDDSAVSCDSDLGGAAFAPRYAALAERSGGKAWSICGDLGDIAESIGLTVSEQRLDFALSTIPALDTLTVEIYASVDDEELLASPVRDVDYTLYAVENEEDSRQEVWIRVVDGLLPPGTFMVVSYEALPGTSRLDLPTGGT